MTHVELKFTNEEQALEFEARRQSALHEGFAAKNSKTLQGS